MNDDEAFNDESGDDSDDDNDDDDDIMTEWFERMTAYEMIYRNNLSMRQASELIFRKSIAIEQIKTNESDL